MKLYVLFVLLVTGLICNCTSHEQQTAVQQRVDSLNKKEQELQSREKELQLQKEALTRREQRLDSALRQDTAYTIDSTLIGTWSTKMVCTETTCTGSAVGDTKNEQWNFSYEGATLVVRAVANDTSARIYSGRLNNDMIELQQQTPVSVSPGAVSIRARLRKTDETHLEGQREIVREDDCRIVYALTVQKQ